MRRVTTTIATILGLAAASSAAAGELTIRLKGVAAAEGNVRVALFADAAAFEADAPLAGIFLPASQSEVEVVLRGIAPGRYGVSAFHDRDGDEELGRNLVGMPTEPFGFAHNARGRFGPPEFEAMSVLVGDTPAQVELELR